MRSSAVRWTVPAALLAAAQAFPLHPLRDAATGEALRDLGLAPSPLHLLTTPFSAYADWITCNGLRQHVVLGVWLLSGYWVWRSLRGFRGLRPDVRGYVLYLAGVFAFLAFAFVLPRPAARLTTPDEEGVAVVDFHSHSSRSWDGRKSFTPAANAAWHESHGFDSGFLTDHNTFDPGDLSFEPAGPNGYRNLRGTELSLHGAHVAALGVKARIDNEAYAGLDGLKRFLGGARRDGVVAVMSLPEYWKHHRDRLETLADWGAAGFELVNATPKGLELPEEGRREVVELCRRRGLFLAGATDNHGWAQSACVWNLVRFDPKSRAGQEEALLDRLRRGGFEAVTVVERARWPSSNATLPIDPLLSLWTLLRTLSPVQAAICLAYSWGLLELLRRFLRRFD